MPSREPIRGASLIGAALTAAACVGLAGAMEIDADFPGGNIIVDRIEGDIVHLRADLRDTTSWWFYWNFRVRGAAGRAMRFSFDGASPIGVNGPAVRLGETWAWLGSEAVDDRADGASFRYEFASDADDVQFAFAFPYQVADLQQFIASHPAVTGKGERLCRTPKGRNVDLLRIGDRFTAGKSCVLLTARHHACESMASFVLEGFLETILGNDELATRLRQQADFIAVPIVDCDGVEEGDQGKNRRPHDHWLDYQGESRYPEVAALRRIVPEWLNGRPLIAIDFHCSYIREASDSPGSSQRVFFMNSMVDSTAHEAARYQTLLEQLQRGPLRYQRRHDLPFGSRWNTAEIAAPSFLGWASNLPETRMATVLEVPYADANGVTVTPDSARLLGRDMAVALDAYLAARTEK